MLSFKLLDFYGVVSGRPGVEMCHTDSFIGIWGEDLFCFTIGSQFIEDIYVDVLWFFSSGSGVGLWLKMNALE
jgi:hypothetical protein